MKTRIRTIHEEEVISDEKNRTLGVLENTSLLDDWKESFLYIYNKEGRYIFFTTIIDMMDFFLYGNGKMKRAYVEEDEFDKFYDEIIDGTFSDLLKWID